MVDLVDGFHDDIACWYGTMAPMLLGVPDAKTDWPGFIVVGVDVAPPPALSAARY